MKKQIISIVSVLLVCLSMFTTANAGCSRFSSVTHCGVGDTLYSYVFNGVMSSYITVKSIDENFYASKGHWAIDKSQARFLGNIEMHASIEYINPTSIGVLFHHTLEIDIDKYEHKGVCTLIYRYVGVQDPDVNGAGGVDFTKIELDKVSCSDKYMVTTRGAIGYPNSLLVYEN